MNNQFQDINFLRALYKNKGLIGFRGNSLKKYSNRKYSIRDVILKLLPKLENKNVIDVGCGNCSFLEKVQKIYPNNYYYGLDIATNKRCLRKKYINYKIYDGVALPRYKIKFDVIFCMHTIYHIRDLEIFFNEVKRYLKKKGIFVITTKSKFTLPKVESTFLHVIKKLGLNRKLNLNPYRDESRFCLENGMKILNKYFAKKYFCINEYILETQIIVDDYRDFLKYIFSTHRYNLSNKLNKDTTMKYRNAWEREIKNQHIFMDKYIEVIYIIKRL